MGKMKENPRYTIFSCRFSDEEAAQIRELLKGKTRQEFIHAAVMLAVSMIKWER